MSKKFIDFHLIVYTEMTVGISVDKVDDICYIFN